MLASERLEKRVGDFRISSWFEYNRCSYSFKVGSYAKKLNVLGGTFLDSDTVSALSNACPSMVASKIYHISAPSTTTPSAGLQREWYSRTQFSVQEFKLMTLNDPSLSSDVAEMFWAHPTTNTYKGINISNCAKINITIVASEGSVISWYMKPESAQAADNTVKYGHELGIMQRARSLKAISIVSHMEITDL